MNISIKEYASFAVAGISIETNNHEADKTIPALWARFQDNNIMADIPQKLDNSVVYGVYSHYQGNEQDNYQLLVGTEVQEGSVVKPPLSSLEISIARYVVCEVTHRDDVINAWVKIWRSQLNRAFVADFERYTADSIEIYIGIVDDGQTDKAIISSI
jgi:predicted transcriptional regulator YdeE